MEGIIYHSLYIDQLYEPPLLPQVLLFIRRRIPARFDVPEQRSPLMMKDTEIDDLMGLCAIWV